MKTVPAKYSRCGIKIKCLKCTWIVNDVCRLKNKSIKTCDHSEKHRFYLVVHIPGTAKGKIRRLSTAETFEEALKELIAFKEELQGKGYHKAIVRIQTVNTSVAHLMKEYLNYISGNGTHAHLHKKLSDDHIKYYEKVFLRFCTAIKKSGYNPEKLDVKDINDDIVEVFHFHVESMGLNKTTYSKHFVLMKAFVNWVIEKKGYKVSNAFEHVSLQFEKRQKNPITKEEFEKLIEVTTSENGFDIDEKTGKKRNKFRPWLVTAFKLGLETGLRREEIATLTWNNIREVHYQGNTCLILDVNNLKNNRRMFGTDSGEYVKPVPVTKGLHQLLLSLGYEQKKGAPEYIIERDRNIEIENLLDSISRGFTHFIKKVTDRKIEFKDLRKTYITHLAMRLGKNTKIFTGHGDDQVLKDSYIAEEFIAASLSDFSVFGHHQSEKFRA